MSPTLLLRRAAAGTPSVRRLDLALSPIEAARRLRHRRRVALLDSSAPGGAEARWSILAADPSALLEGRGGVVALTGPGDAHRSWSDPFAALAGLLDRFPAAAARERDELPFAGGAIGYLGFDLFRSLERYAPGFAVDDQGLPDLSLGLYDGALVFDHEASRWWFAGTPGAGRSAAALERLLDDWLAALEPAGEPSPAPGWSAVEPLVSDEPREPYLAAVGEALELIRAGEIYQVNLARRLRAPLGRPAFELFAALREVSPSRYGAFLDAGDHEVVSSSPELFLRRRGDVVETRPIKGTRPRGATAEEDSRLRAELAASPKERAELAMIVDLSRNDLGRVCELGSVEVAAHAEIESLPTVHHTVSTVRGRLRPGTSAVDLLRATFPAGSISGCPKIRALQVIDALEPVRRHVYTGAIGAIGFDGDLTLNVAIRTAVAHRGQLHFHVGSGIVADSDPESEYEETVHKARGIVHAIERLGASGG